MKLRLGIWILLFVVVVLLPSRSPAPLIFIPGEGWYYENYGETGKWQRPRAKEQLDVAEQSFTNKNYTVTLHAAHRILRVWPLSDYAPRAAYLVGRCLETQGKDEAAFNAYQQIIEKYPKSGQYNEVLWRQYEIANRFLGGEWFKIFNLVPLYPSMDETAKLYGKIVGSGPYSEVAPHAQLRIGAAREKQKDYAEAVRAYETAADRYHEQPLIAADANYRAGLAWEKQADTAEYDQGPPPRPSRPTPISSRSIPMTSAWPTRRKPSSNSRPSRCAAVSRSPNFTNRATNGPARWCITTPCCSSTPIRRSPPRPGSALMF